LKVIKDHNLGSVLVQVGFFAERKDQSYRKAHTVSPNCMCMCFKEITTVH